MRNRFRLATMPVVFGLTILTASAPALALQTTTLADLGLPELNITVTADSYEGIPEELEAGRYLVTVTATEETTEIDGGGVGFFQPVGPSVDEVLGMLAPPEGDASPDASPAAPPEGEGGEEGGDGPPPFFFDSVFAGGTYAAPGESSQIVLDLTPGDWIAWGDDPVAPWTPVVFTVTGEVPADQPEPETSATITMGEYLIDVSEGTLTSGPQIIRVDNKGAQPHFVFITKGPDDLTDDQVKATLEMEMTGTPVAGATNPDEDFVDVAFTGTQSNGTSQWVEVDLEPGRYLMICFFPDKADGMPHAYHGMYSIVDVAP